MNFVIKNRRTTLPDFMLTFNRSLKRETILTKLIKTRK